MTKSGRALQILRRSVYHTSSPFASVSGLVVNSTIWNFLVTYVTYECGWRLAAQTAVIGPTDTCNYTIVCYIHCRILAIIVRIVTRPSQLKLAESLILANDFLRNTTSVPIPPKSHYFQKLRLISETIYSQKLGRNSSFITDPTDTYILTKNEFRKDPRDKNGLNMVRNSTGVYGDRPHLITHAIIFISLRC